MVRSILQVLAAFSLVVLAVFVLASPSGEPAGRFRRSGPRSRFGRFAGADRPPVPRRVPSGVAVAVGRDDQRAAVSRTSRGAGGHLDLVPGRHRRGVADRAQRARHHDRPDAGSRPAPADGAGPPRIDLHPAGGPVRPAGRRAGDRHLPRLGLSGRGRPRPGSSVDGADGRDDRLRALAVLPPDLSADLPAVDRRGAASSGKARTRTPARASWTSRTGGQLQSIPGGGPARRGRIRPARRTLLWCGTAAISDLIDPRVGPAERPVLYAAHVTTPHSPWTRSPGRPPVRCRHRSTPGVDVRTRLTWRDPRCRETAAAPLAAATPTPLGRAAATLSRRVWDDAVVWSAPTTGSVRTRRPASGPPRREIYASRCSSRRPQTSRER